MSFGNALIEIERIKELSLISGLASHHRRNPLANRENGITPLRLRQRVFQQHRLEGDVPYRVGDRLITTTSASEASRALTGLARFRGQVHYGSRNARVRVSCRWACGRSARGRAAHGNRGDRPI